MNDPARSPWREPMVWLVAGLPAAAMLAAVVLIVILVRSSGSNTDDVTEPAQETSQGHVLAPGSPPP
jgi:uncharacterized protein